MRKRMMAAVCVLVLALGCLGNVLGEVYINVEKPEDWEFRPLMRLIVFSFCANDAMLLECGGETMLIDGGVRGKYPALSKAMAEMGLTRVNWFFNTHPHDDHIGAQYKLIEHGLVLPEGFISPFPEGYRNTEQKKMVRLLQTRDIPYIQMNPGETMTLGPATLTLYRWEEGRDPNGLSAVLHVCFGEATLLLTGDIAGQGQNWLVSHMKEGGLKSDILKFPHHAITRMPQAFLNAVDPKLVLITNTTGSTAQEREQVRLYGAEVMNNSVGRITIETYGTDWYVIQEKGVI